MVAAVNAPLADPLDPQRGKPQFLNILSGNGGRTLSASRGRFMICVCAFHFFFWLPLVLTRLSAAVRII